MVIYRFLDYCLGFYVQGGVFLSIFIFVKKPWRILQLLCVLIFIVEIASCWNVIRVRNIMRPFN